MIFKRFAVIFWMLILTSGVCFAAEDENTLKAAYIGNFTQFIEWPEMNTSVFNLVIIKDDPIKNAFEEMGKTLLLKGKKINIIQLRTHHEISLFCNSFEKNGSIYMIYIPKSAETYIPKIVAATQNLPVVLISETPGAAQQGIHINFFTTTEQYLRFEINERECLNHGLHVSSRLLKLAKIINPKENL